MLADYLWVVITLIANGLLRPPQRRGMGTAAADPSAS
jgi:hypothetical protein